MELSGESAQGAAQPSEPPQASADLILRARRGDGAAWEALVRLYQQPAFRLAYLLLGDTDEAEDVAQETFLRAWKALDRFDLSRPMLPWLLRIAANLVHNRQRSIGRTFGLLQRLVSSESRIAGGETNGHEGRWQSQALWSAVRRLGQADQQIIYLRYFLDMSVEETALAMDVPTGTVKSRLHRALGRLRAVIDRDYPDLRDIWA